MITFQQAWWLLLLIPFGVTLYLWPLPTRWLAICRAMVGLALILALSHPMLRLPDRSGTVVVVADRSQSLPPKSTETQREAIHLLHQAMGPRDQLAVVSFGYNASVELSPQRAQFGGFLAEVGADASNLSEGLESALSLIPPGSPGRILVLSDGRWTGRDPMTAALRAAERGIAFDYRIMARPAAHEVSIHQFQTPQSVAPQESYYLNAWVQSPSEREVQYQLFRGAQVISSGSRSLQTGLNRLMFRDRAGEVGPLSYRLVITSAEEDPFPENNQARALVGVRSKRRLLHVAESGASSGLAALLQKSGLDVVTKPPTECAWTLEELSQYSAVVLENLTANHLRGNGLETVALWVEHTGSGLMMTGGRKSYGPGGYFKSPLERILPVSMEMRQEHRKSKVAIVVAMDRSGSMAAPVGDGRMKMDLANLGAVQVLDMLMPGDELGVIAVDSSPHTIVELNTVAVNAAHRSRILAIDSMGGGIFIFEALSSAARMLMSAKAEKKHIILFADAADSEEPGAYIELLDHCRQAGISVSVIGLGTPADQDAALLEDIGRRGDGNCYFTDSPEEIPRLFAQDTFTVARSSFIEEVTPFKVTAAMLNFGGTLNWQPPSLGGYNLCYLRPEALLAAVTTDEYNAPIVAGWQAGRGRVLCFTGEADGEYSGPFVQWNQAGDFYASLARWAMGEQSALPDSMLLTHEVKEGALAIQIHLDPDRAADQFGRTPAVTLLHGISGRTPRVQSLPFQWTSADLLEVQVPIRGQETLLPTVNIPGFNPVMLSPACLPFSPEFQPDREGRGPATLVQMARATGGEERIDLSKIWKALPRSLRLINLAPWLIILGIVLFLLEIFQRRTGLLTSATLLAPFRSASIQEPVANKVKSLKKRLRRKQPAPPAPSVEALPASLSAAETPAPATEKPRAIDAMRLARRRAQQRRPSGHSD